MRDCLFRVVILAAVCTGGWSGADAASLDYYGQFGEWTVICAAEAMMGNAGRPAAGTMQPTTRCAIEGQAAREGSGEASLVVIEQADAEEAALAVRRVRSANPFSATFLRVDARPPSRMGSTPAGEVVWRGAEAQAVIQELLAGKELVVRTFIGPELRPFDEIIALKGFSAALAAYLERTQSPGPTPPSSDPSSEPASPEREQPR